MSKTLITVAEAAELLGVKRQTIYLWVRQGLLPCYRVGKRLIKFDPDELLACFKIDQCVTEPPKVAIATRPLTEPFRVLGQSAESAEAKEQRARYRALLGVVK